jgi:urease accessory protein
MKISPCAAPAALALATLSGVARAHGWHDDGNGGGFAAGFLHPFSGIDHLLAMLAVGLWSANASPRPWLAPLCFATVMIAGAVATGSGVLPGWVPGSAEPMIAASVLVLGLLVAWRVQLPAAAGAALVGGFALFHGAAHGAEVSTAAAALAGLAVATALLHGVGMLMGFALRRARQPWQRVLGGAIGGGIALTGLGLGAGAIGALAAFSAFSS